MKKYTLLGIISVAVSVLFLLGLIFYNQYYHVKTTKLDMYFEIADKIGFNLDSDAIYFGKTYPGGRSQRIITLENNEDFPVKVSIKTEGTIRPLVTVSKNDFILQPHSVEVIRYYADAGDYPKGNYSGVSTAVFTRVIFT